MKTGIRKGVFIHLHLSHNELRMPKSVEGTVGGRVDRRGADLPTILTSDIERIIVQFLLPA